VDKRAPSESQRPAERTAQRIFASRSILGARASGLAVRAAVTFARAIYVIASKAR
jgi:hypothetical protein